MTSATQARRSRINNDDLSLPSRSLELRKQPPSRHGVIARDEYAGRSVEEPTSRTWCKTIVLINTGLAVGTSTLFLSALWHANITGHPLTWGLAALLITAIFYLRHEWKSLHR